MNSNKIRRQPPVKGGRQPLPACVLREIHSKVERLARIHKVSRSFVIATILADALKIDKQVKYYEV